MTPTSSHAALLRIALQDLHAGKLLLQRRLPALRDAIADPTLDALVETLVAAAGTEATRLADLGLDTGGPKNLWMAGILDDADRDSTSHQPGVLRDIALVGALRKAMAAQIVSSETAVALARQAALPEFVAAAEANHASEIQADHQLRQRLSALTAA